MAVGFVLQYKFAVGYVFFCFAGLLCEFVFVCLSFVAHRLTRFACASAPLRAC